MAGSDLAVEFKALGMPAAEIDRWQQLQQAEADVITVHRSAGAALRLFFASGTQWRTAGMAGIPTGLDYAGVRAAAIALGMTWSTRLFGDLRALEAGAVKAFAEKVAKT